MGGGGWGLGVGGWAPTPQPPIPNPQSPIPILNYLNNNIIQTIKWDKNIILISKFKLK